MHAFPFTLDACRSRASSTCDAWRRSLSIARSATCPRCPPSFDSQIRHQGPHCSRVIHRGTCRRHRLVHGTLCVWFTSHASGSTGCALTDPCIGRGSRLVHTDIVDVQFDPQAVCIAIKICRSRVVYQGTSPTRPWCPCRSVAKVSLLFPPCLVHPCH